MKIKVIAIILLSGLSVAGQNRILKWSDALCEYQGTYNSRKYTAAQLRGTLRLFWPGEFSLSTNTSVFSPEDIPKLNISALDQEYKTLSAALKGLNIVKTTYWENQRQMKLREIEQVYVLSRISMQAYKDPVFLNKYAGAESCKLTYASPLIAGGEPLLTVWRQVNAASRSKNGDPESVRRKFEEQYKSPDRMKFALVEVLTFGWWNCANEYIKYVEYDGSQEQEFEKLFVRVKKIHCDEP